MTMKAQNIAPKQRTPTAPTLMPVQGQQGSTARKKPRHLEDDLQRQVVTWFRLQYPEFAPLLFAIPNGGQRGKFEAARMKAQGVTAGVPDLFLARPKHGREAGTIAAAGLFLELKVGANKPSDAQKQMLERLQAQGYNACLIYSFDAFREAIRAHIGY